MDGRDVDLGEMSERAFLATQEAALAYQHTTSFTFHHQPDPTGSGLVPRAPDLHDINLNPRPEHITYKDTLIRQERAFRIYAIHADHFYYKSTPATNPAAAMTSVE